MARTKIVEKLRHNIIYMKIKVVPAGDKELGFTVLGDRDGWTVVGKIVGHVEGATEGSLVAVGDEVRVTDGVRIGSLLGDREGGAVGESVGHVEETMEGGLVVVGDKVVGNRVG